jgi:hypothetical protein
MPPRAPHWQPCKTITIKSACSNNATALFNLVVASSRQVGKRDLEFDLAVPGDAFGDSRNESKEHVGSSESDIRTTINSRDKKCVGGQVFPGSFVLR